MHFSSCWLISCSTARRTCGLHIIMAKSPEQTANNGEDDRNHEHQRSLSKTSEMKEHIEQQKNSTSNPASDDKNAMNTAISINTAESLTCSYRQQLYAIPLYSKTSALQTENTQ